MRGDKRGMTAARRLTGCLFPPPTAAVSLYRGEVMHARLKPVGHRFVYRVFNLLIDLDRLEAADRASASSRSTGFNLAASTRATTGPATARRCAPISTSCCGRAASI